MRDFRRLFFLLVFAHEDTIGRSAQIEDLLGQIYPLSGKGLAQSSYICHALHNLLFSMCDEVRRTDVRLISDAEGVVTQSGVPPVSSGSVHNEEPADTRQLSKVAEIFLDMGSSMDQSELPCHLGQARASRGGYLMVDILPLFSSPRV